MPDLITYGKDNPKVYHSWICDAGCSKNGGKPLQDARRITLCIFILSFALPLAIRFVTPPFIPSYN